MLNTAPEEKLSTVTALQIGLDADAIDYDAPEFAAIEGLTHDSLQKANDDNIALMRAAGYDVDGCPIDFGETALVKVRGAVTAKRYDAILIGAGVRLIPGNTQLFEAIVNLVHATLSDCRFVFNQAPEPTPDDIRRWFPESTTTTKTANR